MKDEKRFKKSALKDHEINAILDIFPYGIHKTLGRIKIYGIRTKSLYSEGLMYMTMINDDILWLHEHEIKLEYSKNKYEKMLYDAFLLKINECVSNPSLNLDDDMRQTILKRITDGLADVYIG